jgi:hypothetical protein
MLGIASLSTSESMLRGLQTSLGGLGMHKRGGIDGHVCNILSKEYTIDFVTRFQEFDYLLPAIGKWHKSIFETTYSLGEDFKNEIKTDTPIGYYGKVPLVGAKAMGLQVKRYLFQRLHGALLLDGKLCRASRLLSNTAQYSGAFIDSPLRFTHREFIDSVKGRLLMASLPEFAINSVCPHPKCVNHKIPIDWYTHAQTCHSVAGIRKKKHDMVVSLLNKFIIEEQPEWTMRREVWHYGKNANEVDHNLKSDIEITRSDGEQPIILDVAIVLPDRRMNSRIGRRAGEYAKTKHAKYEKQVGLIQPGGKYEFIACICETSGLMNKEFLQFIDMAATSQSSKSVLRKNISTTLSLMQAKQLGCLRSQLITASTQSSNVQSENDDRMAEINNLDLNDESVLADNLLALYDTARLGVDVNNSEDYSDYSDADSDADTVPETNVNKDNDKLCAMPAVSVDKMPAISLSFFNIYNSYIPADDDVEFAPVFQFLTNQKHKSSSSNPSSNHPPCIPESSIYYQFIQPYMPINAIGNGTRKSSRISPRSTRYSPEDYFIVDNAFY